MAHKGKALDLGSGAGKDSRYLVDQGFLVTAIDRYGPRPPGCVFHSVLFENYRFPQSTFDLINAQYSLPFIKPAEFRRVWDQIVAALAPGGLFIGQLFGVNDDWADNPAMSFFSATAVQALVAGLKLVHFKEREFPGKTAVGQEKDWHIFDLVLKKT